MSQLPDDRPGERIAWFWQTPAVEPEGPSPLREPARLVIVLGCVFLAFTALMPHAEGIIPGLPDVALRFIPDSGVLLIIAVALGLVVGRRDTSESRQWVIQVLPIVLGIGSVVTWLNILRLSEQAIADWIGFRGSGHLTWIFVVGGAASVIVALFSIWLVITRFRQPVPDEPVASIVETVAVRPPRQFVPSVAGAIGAVAGAVVALAAVVTLIQGGGYILPLLGVFAAFYGAMVGSWVGSAIGRRLESMRSTK